MLNVSHLVARVRCSLGRDQSSFNAGYKLKSSDDEIDIMWIELNSKADTAGLVGGNESGAGTKERINDDLTAVGDIQQGIFQHGCGLDGVTLPPHLNPY